MADTFVQLLGAPQARVGTGVVPFDLDKRYQLLAYLARADGWVRRDRIAFLFWPDIADRSARTNVRHLLYRVRTLSWKPELESEAQRVRWRPRTDADAFLQALSDARWNDALEHYRGPLLDGLDDDAGDEYRAWLELERTGFQQRWRSAVFGAAERHGIQGRHRQAAQLLERLLAGDAFDEEALRGFMEAVARDGGRERALQAYRAFSLRLRDDFGLEPTAALEQFAGSIRDGAPRAGVARAPAPVATAATPRSPRALPDAATPFVGRDFELGEVAAGLAQAECRLLTLVGAGGVGKSRVAQQAAREHEGLYDEIHFVPLEALAAAPLVPGAIAAEVGIDLSQQDDPVAPLAAHFAERRALLLLDNFEHLLEAGPVVARLLDACPRLKVIATSRERLGLEREWLLPLEGLPIPADDIPLEEARQVDAVRLFELQCRRLRPDFTVDDRTLADVLAICRAVVGYPLGLELAAAWVRVLPLADLVGEIRANLDFLRAAGRDAGGRHHSVRAVFEHSYALLTPAERTVLRRLALFRGGFRNEAASQVASARLPLLAALVDKSLLQLTPEGRFECHPLLFQYIGEKLDGDPELGALLDAHASYYLGLVRRLGERLMGPAQEESYLAIEHDLDNIRAAWSRAVQRGAVRELRQAIETLGWFFTMRARAREAIALFDEALERLDEDDPEQRPVLAALWVERSYQELRLSRFEAARTSVGKGLGFLAGAQQPEVQLIAANVEGTLADHDGDLEAARHHFERQLSLAQALGTTETGALLSLARIEDFFGNYRQSRRRYRQALARSRERANIGDLIATSINFAGSLRQAGAHDEARPLLEEGLELARRHDYHTYLPYLLAGVGDLAEVAGDHEAAEVHQREALEAARQGGDALVEIAALTALGRLALRHEREREAEDWHEEALRLAWRLQEIPEALWALVNLADCWAAQGRRQEAAELLAVAAAHPRLRDDHRIKAAERLAELERRGAEPGRRDRDLNAVIEHVLHDRD